MQRLFCFLLSVVIVASACSTNSKQADTPKVDLGGNTFLLKHKVESTGELTLVLTVYPKNAAMIQMDIFTDLQGQVKNVYFMFSEDDKGINIRREPDGYVVQKGNYLRNQFGKLVDPKDIALLDELFSIAADISNNFGDVRKNSKLSLARDKYESIAQELITIFGSGRHKSSAWNPAWVLNRNDLDFGDSPGPNKSTVRLGPFLGPLILSKFL